MSLSDHLSLLSSAVSAHLSSRQAQLAVATGASVAVTTATILALQRARRESRLKDLKSSIPPVDDSTTLTDFGAPSRNPDADTSDAALAARARRGTWDETIILEQLARNRVFLGDCGLSAVRNSFVIVVGCGGVGSWAATMLVRSGVGTIRLIDFDQVTLSSLNRHAVATLADVGTPKVHTLRKRLEQVAPWCNIEVRNELWSVEDGERLLAGEPTWVVDAIDNIETKVDLLAFCKTRGIKVVSSMGAGCKSDPTRIHVGDIADSQEDPLSRSTRRRLKLRGVTSGIPVVYSSEKPGPGKASLLPLDEEEFAKGKVGELGVLPDFRVRILPVLGTMPAFFGACVANYVLCQIAGYPLEFSAGKARGKMYEEMLTKLVGLESRLRGNLPGVRVALSEADVAYVVEEVFRGKSVVSGVSTRLLLVRWESLPEKEGGGFWAEDEHRVGIADVVVMTKEEAKRHESEVLKGGKSVAEVWGEKVLELVNIRREEEAFYAKYR